MRDYAVLVQPGYQLADKPRYKATAETVGAVWIAAAHQKPKDRDLLILAKQTSHDKHLTLQPRDFLLSILRHEHPADRAAHRVKEAAARQR